MKIVIADDDATSRIRLQGLLKAWGYEVISVPNGREACEALQQEDAPKLGILDWIMPEMDGIEVVQKVRSMRHRVPPYLMLLTSLDSTADTVRALEAGADGYITKPFDPQELRARLQAGSRIVQLQIALTQRVSEVVRALSARKRAEEALMQERSLLHALMDNLPDAIFFKDMSGKFIRVNNAMAGFLRLNHPPDATGKTELDFLAPEYAQSALNDEQNIIKSNQPLIEKEERKVWPGGREMWVSTTRMPMRAIDGHIAGTFGISRDITARKRAEEALQKSEERAHLLFATIPQPVWVYDPETLMFIEVNDAAINHYGYSREEFLAMKITAVRPPEEVGVLLENLRQPRPPRQSSGQWKHRTKDGTVIDVEISSHSINDFFGRKAVLVVAQDITERKRLEVDLRHAQKLEAVGGLAAGIAHEINTPIQFVGDNVRFLEGAFATIGGLLNRYRKLRDAVAEGKDCSGLVEEISKSESKADLDWLAEEAPKAVSQTLDGVNRVATIVRAMKDFAHPDRSEKTAADLNKALESTLIVARNELKYIAEVETRFGKLSAVLCYPGDLNQVFLNLLVNAAHAIGDVVKGTGQKGIIRVETRQEGEAVEIRISDTGAGIPENIQHKIFEPFFTTKDIGRGTGQGLAIARSVVVDKHGGSLTFETVAGRGTTFVVRLPIGGTEAADAIAKP